MFWFEFMNIHNYAIHAAFLIKKTGKLKKNVSFFTFVLRALDLPYDFFQCETALRQFNLSPA